LAGVEQDCCLYAVAVVSEFGVSAREQCAVRELRKWVDVWHDLATPPLLPLAAIIGLPGAVTLPQPLPVLE
jgi:hypothetical protein